MASSLPKKTVWVVGGVVLLTIVALVLVQPLVTRMAESGDDAQGRQHVREQLAHVQRYPAEARAVFNGLREHYHENSALWSEQYLYQLSVFECPVDAAVEFIRFLCFLVDEGVEEARRQLWQQVRRGGDEPMRLSDFIEQRRAAGAGFEATWERVETLIDRVEPSPTKEFVLWLR